MKQTIAQNMYQIMKQKHISYIWYGDIALIEECAKKTGVMKKHPKDTIITILNALDSSPLFTKSYIKVDINGANRRYRCFKIV